MCRPKQNECEEAKAHYFQFVCPFLIAQKINYRLKQFTFSARVRMVLGLTPIDKRFDYGNAGNANQVSFD